MSVESIKLEGDFSIDVKRFYLPFIFNVECPHCGEKIEKDLNDQYLSYPDVNKEEEAYFYCDECEGEFEVPFTLEINITTDMKKTKKL